MFSTQLRRSSKKNQIKRSSYVTVMPFTNQEIYSSREFRPPEKLKMTNLLSDEPATNSIMPNVIIHVLNVQESLGLDGFQKGSKTDLFGPNGETDKILAKGKDGFRPAKKKSSALARKFDRDAFYPQGALHQPARRAASIESPPLPENLPEIQNQLLIQQTLIGDEKKMDLKRNLNDENPQTENGGTCHQQPLSDAGGNDSDPEHHHRSTTDHRLNQIWPDLSDVSKQNPQKRHQAPLSKPRLTTAPVPSPPGSAAGEERETTT
ncbi:hypothetical protein DY000_02061392 [Brassica cretica]|nr:hypothetical protein DY000_02061392 [Brassica cretica]